MQHHQNHQCDLHHHHQNHQFYQLLLALDYDHLHHHLQVQLVEIQKMMLFRLFLDFH